MKHLNFSKGAPFSKDQKTWISGFLSGMETRILQNNANISQKDTSDSSTTDFINILYGTQTGTSENLAEEMLSSFKSNGFEGNAVSLSDINLDDMSKMKKAFFVISTYGEGEMPDNAQLFWEDLNSSSAPKFGELEYGVLALGDTSYEDFCQAGKLLDMRMEQLGAKRVIERVDCDVDYEEKSSLWINDLIKLIQPSEKKIVKTSSEKSKWSRKNPFFAKITENTLLSGKNSNKEIRHYEIDLEGSDLTYEVGDSINIFPVNNDDLVKRFLEKLKLDGNVIDEGKGKSFYDLFKFDLDISTPSKDLLILVEKSYKNKNFSNILLNSDKSRLDSFLYGKDILDILNIEKNVEIKPQSLIDCLRPLQHRAYSIASSPKSKKNKVQITVSTLRWNVDNRNHEGVCSTFLADRLKKNEKVKVFMTPNKSFRLPSDDSIPIIMVGPGTGVAPFKAFLEERQLVSAKGMNWLFFGDQTRKDDYIYKSFFSNMIENGILTKLDLAFSRDQEEKVYVQSKMLDNGKSIYEWLEKGAYFYVCGDASKMAKDVETALVKIIHKHSNCSLDDANEYLVNLKRNKRYQRDVY